jgi:hypothetical protein
MHDPCLSIRIHDVCCACYVTAGYLLSISACQQIAHLLECLHVISKITTYVRRKAFRPSVNSISETRYVAPGQDKLSGHTPQPGSRKPPSTPTFVNDPCKSDKKRCQ